MVQHSASASVKLSHGHNIVHDEFETALSISLKRQFRWAEIWTMIYRDTGHLLCGFRIFGKKMKLAELV